MSKILKKMDVFWIHQHSTSAASLWIYISLNKCYYVLALSMNIVSGSRLSRDGYHFESVKNGCSISKDCISMFMHLIVMVYIFWISIVMKHISTVWMPRNVSLVMIIPCSCGIAILGMLA
jgi:hypothetical protein